MKKAEDAISRWMVIIPAAEQDVCLLHCWPEETISLEDMQKIVEGYIETVPLLLPDSLSGEENVKLLMIVNEEGKLMGLPRNRQASILSAADRIVGNAIIAGARGEEIIGLREEAALEIKETVLKLAGRVLGVEPDRLREQAAMEKATKNPRY